MTHRIRSVLAIIAITIGAANSWFGYDNIPFFFTLAAK
jgi:hypothetical protein